MSMSARAVRAAEEKRLFGEMIARHEIALQMEYPLSDIPLGWAALVEELLRDLSALGCRNIVQIKPKFAELRVYLADDGTDAAEALVEQATERSRRTCEHCGAAGTVERMPRRGVVVLCASCRAMVLADAD